jgi:hypothetical protein
MCEIHVMAGWAKEATHNYLWFHRIFGTRNLKEGKMLPDKLAGRSRSFE